MYLDIPAELPGVILEDDIGSEQVVMDEPEPDFVEQATAVLNNVGIDPQDRLQLLQEQHKAGHGPIGPAPAKNNQDEIVYEITYDFTCASNHLFSVKTQKCEENVKCEF